MPERVGRSLMGTVKLSERRAEEAIFLRDELEQIAFGSNRDRHCERSEAIQGNVVPYGSWIAASLRSSR
jgi:hypothetical protein